MRNKNLTAAAAVATAAALMLAGCATQKPAASSSEAASTAPAESSVVEETTPEEAPSEATDVDEAAAEDLLLSTETMHYSADDEDGVVTVHKYDENGNEVFMREIDKASDMDTVIIKELDENGNVLKMTSYLNGEQNYLYTQVFNDHGALIGAVMVAGILTDGKGTPRISKELVQNFERKCGATICKDLKGIGTGKVLCPCPECVRNAVFSLGEVLGK